MTLQQAISIVAFLFAVSGLWVLCVLWRNYRLDAFRQELFEIREQLFDLGTSGQISFDNPAYWRLRTIINSLIRFGHNINLSRLVVPYIFLKRHASDSPGPYEKWLAAVEETRADVKPVLLDLHERVIKAVAWQLLVVSPLTLPLIALWHVVPEFRLKLKSAVAKVEDQAALEDELRIADAA